MTNIVDNAVSFLIGEVVDQIPETLWGLAAEALKYSTFAEFEHAFLVEIKHGLYWHVTEDPGFTIDPAKGPRDMSSIAIGHESNAGKLMITSHLEYWADEYSNSRMYAALIDMSQVPKEAYYQVNRGMGNEFFVQDPSKAAVLEVYNLKAALRLDSDHHAALPSSSEELEQFYNSVHERI